MVYLITYDLNKLGKNYDSLYSELRRYDYIRDIGLDSVWFVSTSWTVNQIYNDLCRYIDENDRIFITRIQRGEHQGWMNKNIWSWINEKI